MASHCCSLDPDETKRLEPGNLVKVGDRTLVKLAFRVQRCVAASTDKFSPHHSNGVKGKASGNRRHPGTSFEKIEIRERKERT